MNIEHPTLNIEVEEEEEEVLAQRRRVAGEEELDVMSYKGRGEELKAESGKEEKRKKQ